MADKNDSDVITACRINTASEPHKITAVFNDGAEVEVIYTFFSDEKSYDAQSFVGLTREAARRRTHANDVEYLRSPQRPMAF